MKAVSNDRLFDRTAAGGLLSRGPAAARIDACHKKPEPGEAPGTTCITATTMEGRP